MVSLKGQYSEHHNCVDCGFNTLPGAPTRAFVEAAFRGEDVKVSFTEDSEVYTVRDSLWERAGLAPYGGVLCVGCLEKRLGRKLKPKDFSPHPFNDSCFPCSERLFQRCGGAAVIASRGVTPAQQESTPP